jgi:hypothetical protein
MALSWYYPGFARKGWENPQNGGPAESRTQRLLNTSVDRYRHANLLGDQLVKRGYIQFC